MSDKPSTFCICVFIYINLKRSVVFITLSSHQMHICVTSYILCCCSVTKSCLSLCTLWAATCQASLSFTISWSWLKLMSIESVMPPNHLILCYPFLLPSIFPSIRVFSSELALYIRLPNYWSFSFSIIPFNEYSELISFRIDRFDLLAIQGTLKSLLQHHTLKASVLWCSPFFMVPFSHHTWLL